jgi:signal transduction histidine kinase
VRPTELIDLSQAWAALEAVREEIEEEAEDPTIRARQHSLLDLAAFKLAGAAVGQTVYSNRRVIEEIAHDIRSPLNSILLLADSLHQGHAGPLNAVQKREARVLYTAAVTLVRLVNDLMDAARLASDRHKITRTPFSLSTVLAETRNLVAPLAAHRSVHLAFEPATGRRIGDRQLLSRVLLNLASNGVEAAGEKGTVALKIDESDDRSVLAHVRDTGRNADLDRLRALVAESDEFYPRHDQGWTRGLGLAISGRLARAAGGEVTVERVLDGQTQFTVYLPFEEA